MAKKVLIVGVGRFGGALAEELWQTGTELILVDPDADAIDDYKTRCSAAFVADGTDPAVLDSIGARHVDAAVVALGDSFESVVLCVAQLVELGVKVIYARATSPRQAEILKKVGATRAIEVEAEAGRRIAVEVLNPVAASVLDFATHFRVVPWIAVPPYVGRTLSQADLRRFEINVLGYLNKDSSGAAGQAPRLRWPASDYVIQEGDTLLLVSLEDNIERFLASVE